MDIHRSRKWNDYNTNKVKTMYMQKKEKRSGKY